MSFQPTRDLTGQVIKMEPYYFAYGGRADIWMGQWIQKDSKGVEVAVKVFKGLEDLGKRIRLLREIGVWSVVHHENVTPFLGISFDFERPHTPCLVSPYYRNGNITSYLKNNPAVDKLALLAGVASALMYLHSRKIVHGDLKGSNILINDNGKPILTDFGRSRIIQPHGFTTMTASGICRDESHLHDNGGVNLTDLGRSCIVQTFGNFGSTTETESGTHHPMGLELASICEGEAFNPAATDGWRWTAPELMATCLNGEKRSTSLVSEAADIYAFAMTVIEIFTGSIPFSHIKCDASVILSVVAGARPKREHCLSINDEIWTMLEKCWHVEPNQRPSVATISCFLNLRVTSMAAQLARL